MTASKGRRKRIAFSNAVRSRRALRTLWHNACISYRRYEKIRERISFIIFWADDGKHRQKKAHCIFGCRAQPTSAPHALAQCVHFISQIWKIRERFLLYFFWADDGKQRRWEHEVFSIAVRWRRALRTVENRAFISLLHKDIKNPWTNFVHGFGADDQTWTGDLILTNCPWCTKMLLNSGENTKINFNPTHIRSRVHQEKGAVLPKEKRTKKELTRLRLVLRREIA